MLTDLTKTIGNDKPNGFVNALLIDPASRRPYSLASFGRYTAANGESLHVRHAPFSAADNATTELVAAVPGYAIVVVGYIVQSGATAQTFIFKSASTAISNTMQNGAYGGASRPIIYGGGYFETLPGEALNGTTSSAAAAVTTGIVDYVLVPDYSLVDENGEIIVDGDGNPISG